MGNALYKVDEVLGRLGSKLIKKLGPKLGFRCEVFYPVEGGDGIYPSSGTYQAYRESPDKEIWMLITGIITQDKGRIIEGQNDPSTSDSERKGISTELLPLGTKVRVHIPGGRVMDLKVVKVLQDATRTRSFFTHILEPIL